MNIEIFGRFSAEVLPYGSTSFILAGVVLINIRFQFVFLFDFIMKNHEMLMKISEICKGPFSAVSMNF